MFDIQINGTGKELNVFGVSGCGGRILNTVEKEKAFKKNM